MSETSCACAAPFVTVVVLNWNGRRLLPPCLEALARTEYYAGAPDRWEVVVVDNASTDGSPEWVEVAHPWVRVRRNPANWGFGRGNNPALRDAPGPYVVLLNSDTRVRPGWLRALVDALEANPGAGAGTAKLVFPADATGGAHAGRIQNAGGMVLPDGGGRDRGTVVADGVVSHEPDDGRYDSPDEVFFFCGAAAILRKAALEEVGYFDERYFMYYEDLDLSWRLRLRGWTVQYVPGAVVEHEHAASSGEWSPLFTYNVERNRPLMLAKLAPWPLATREVGRYLMEFGLNAARVGWWLASRRERGPHASRARMQARVVLSWIRDLPGVWRDRAVTRSSRRVPDRAIQAWMRAGDRSARRTALASAGRSKREHAAPPSAAESPYPVNPNGPNPLSPNGSNAPSIPSLLGKGGTPTVAAPRRLKVGVYNQFLATLGGGERHMAMAASALAQAGHDVELVTHVPVAVPKLAARFGIDLDGVRLRTEPLLPFDQLRAMTAEYDLFVNASFMSCLPAAARHSMLLVLFPFPLDRTWFGRLKTWVGALLHRQLLVPRYGTGFFGPQELGGSRYRYTAGRGEVVIETPWPGRALAMKVVLGSFRPAGDAPVPVTISAYGTASDWAEPTADPASGTVLWRGEVATTPGNYQTVEIAVPGALTASGSVALVIESPTYRPFERLSSGGPDHFDPDDFRELGVAVARVLVRHPRHYVYEALFERLVPELSRRLHGLPDPRAMEYLRTYDEILPISEFSDEWLERYWDVRGTGILYPPVDVGSITPRPTRDRVILGVGRFFEGSHNKKHDEMIRTFGELVREGALPGWELHLVGGSMPERRHQKYLDRCRALAAGLPVTLHVDAPASVRDDLYARASIFWHATGFGKAEARDPILFEHFGITTVEAMAAGCVPVVIGRGAQPEIVADGRSGFTWTTRAEWKARTLEVARDQILAARLRAGAIMRSRDFGEDVFRTNLIRRVDAMLAAEYNLLRRRCATGNEASAGGA